MYTGNKVTISRTHWDSRKAGRTVTVLEPNFASGLYIEVVGDEGIPFLVEADAVTLVKNPLDL